MTTDTTKDTAGADTAREARIQAVRALEAEFSELIVHFRAMVAENAGRVSPGMLPAAYKIFTTIVRRESVTQTALAEHLLLDKGQLSRTVRELEELGLIVRAPDPTDRRSSLLSPTPFGLQRLAFARGPQEDGLINALAHWPVQDIETLATLLHTLLEDVAPANVRRRNGTPVPE